MGQHEPLNGFQGLGEARLHDHIGPLFRLLCDVPGEVGGAALQRFYSLYAKTIDDRLRPYRARDRLCELVADRIRSGDRSEQPEPDGGIETKQAGLRDCRQIGQAWSLGTEPRIE